MNNLRIPGVAWTVLIVVLVGLIHANAAWIEVNWHVEPWMIDMAITLLIAGLKTLNVGTDQLNDALEVIDQLLNRRAEEAVMSEGAMGIPAPASLSAPVEIEKIPEKPNTFMRWLVG